MFCSECGAKLKNGDRFCGECGAKVTQESVSFGETFESANNQMDDLVDSDEIEVKF